MSVIAGLILLWPITARATKSVVRSEGYSIEYLCPNKLHCQGKGAFVAEEFARKGELRIKVYDIRPSKVLPGYFHLSLRAETGGPGQLVLTNGAYMIPVVLRVSPARANAPQSWRGASPANVLFQEQNGMVFPPVRLDKAVLLGKGKGRDYVLVMDTLWTDSFKQVVDALREAYKRKDRDLPSLYLAPVFGFMSSRTLAVGRYFFALLDLGADPLQTAYWLSGLEHEVKGFSGPMFNAAASFLHSFKKDLSPDAVKRKLKTKLAYWTPERTIQRSAEINGQSGLGLQEYVVIYNGRIYFYPWLVGQYQTNVKTYFLKIF